jgi:CheY-like chemotaxis protein
MHTQEFNVLLVEDNPADVRLLEECLKDIHAHWKVSVAEDGELAIRSLRTDTLLPDLILLDLNLRRKSGHDVLRELKADPGLSTIPVIILSSSQAPADVNEAYRAHANCYVSKPGDLDQYLQVVQLIEDFWHKRAELPVRFAKCSD